MKAFLRALKFAWPYRYRILFSWICALLVAGLYFASFSTVVPLVSFLLGGQATAEIRTQEIPDPQQNDRVITQPTVVIPYGYTGRPVPAGQPVTIDKKTREVMVPAGYATMPGGLEGLIERKRGEWYYPHLRQVFELLPRSRNQALLAIMVFLVIVTVVKSIFRYLNTYTASSVACRTVLDIRHRTFDQVLHLPLGYFQRGGAADSSSRLINDAFALQEGVQTMLGKLVVEPLKIIAMGYLAIIAATEVDSRLILLMLVIGPVTGLAVYTFARRMRRATRKQLRSAADILGMLEESLAGLRVVKAYTMEGRERKRFFRESRRYFRHSLRAFQTQAASSPVLETIGTFGVATAVVIGAYLVGENTDQQEALMLFFISLVGAVDPLRKLSNVGSRLQLAASASERIFELVDTKGESRRGRKGIELPRMARDIRFEQVHFSYNPGGEEVLKDISLDIPAGEAIAIVGRTGCGKSTLVNLLPRFYVPTSGRILIDEIDIQDVTLRSLRDQIGLVSQDTILFSDTILNNVAYGGRPALRKRNRAGKFEREEIIEAIRLAHASEFIEKLPDGYDTEIGTLGGTLSGGQRQRLALARAILRDPSILILDEPTSALDEETQSLVQDTLEQFVDGRTVIIVAHRLSTISLANRIVVMENGTIVDVGPHDELMERCPVYRRLRETGLEG